MKIEEYVKESANEITEFMNGLKINEMHLDVDISKGKKLRGTLVNLISQSVNGDRTKALEFASAIELIQLGSTVHDDLIDEHQERRKSIPLHLLKGAKFAVLSGDRMFTLATKLGAKNGSKEGVEVSEAMESVLSGAIKEIGFLELLRDISGGEVFDKFYFKMIGLKTASLFKSAGRFGAMTFTDSTSKIDEYGDIGYNIGLAYQIADDLTDLVKLGEGTKEPDLGQIIALIPAIFHYNKDSVKKIPFMLLSGRISIDTVMEMMASIDMASKMKEDIIKLNKETEELIDNLDIQNEYTKLLKEYPKYCINQILAEVDEKI